MRWRGVLVTEAARLTDPWCLAAVYFLLLGGLMSGIFVPELRLLGILLAAVVVADLVRNLGQRHDAVDLAAAAALLLFAVGTLASTNPRASLEVLLFGIALLALFVRLRRRFAEPAARDRLLTVVGRVAAGVAVGVALLWIWESLGWWLGGAPGLPPAGLDYSDDWFRNLNLLPVYLALSWPAVAHCLTRRGERWLSFATLAAMLLVTALSAARAAWIGIIAGVAVFGLLLLLGRRPEWRLSRRAAGWLLVAGAVLAAVEVATGVLSALLDGVTDLATLRVRADIWNAALARWGEHPLAGTGLGTITGELLRGGLAAEGRAPAPHAHSVPIQLLAEAGLVGVLAVLVGLAAIAWRALQLRGAWGPDATIRSAAVAAVVAYAVDGLADNHSAIAAVDVLALANLALLAPAHSVPAGVGTPLTRDGSVASPPFTIARAALGLGLLVLLGQALVWSAGVSAWGRAQAAMAGGAWVEADSQLELAVSLDPGLALYGRELGKLRAGLGDAGAGERLLARATDINPADPNASRAVGTLALSAGESEAAIEPLRRAAELDASRMESFLLLGVALDRARLSAEADDAYATAIVLAPSVLLSDGWAAIGVDPDRLLRLVDGALAVSASGEAASNLAPRRAELLVIIGDRDGLERLLETGRVPAADSWRAVAEAEAGNLAEAMRLLERSRGDGRRVFEYWTNAAFVQSLAGQKSDAERSYRLAQLLREAVTPPAAVRPPLLAPIGHDPNDFWMYGRTTSVLNWDAGLPLPSPFRGAWLRLHDPGAIEVPQLRQLRYPGAGSPAGARP